MHHLTRLFGIMEAMRAQPQYGYALAGIPRDEQSDLAQHHYLVTFVAWQLARNLKHAGAKINVGRVLEYAMVHDISELFGSDIAVPYAKLNPEAKKAAKAFEAENQKFLEQFFGPDGEYFRELSTTIVQESEDKPDELIIAKVADWVELIHFLVWVEKGSKRNVDLVLGRMKSFIAKMSDPVAKKELDAFVDGWAQDVLTIETPDKLLNLDWPAPREDE